jgi:hypothetical protein
VDTLSSGSPQLMRRLNSALVLRTIREAGLVSRAEIRRRTGLSKPTVGEVVDFLLGTRLGLSENRSEVLPRVDPRESASPVRHRRCIDHVHHASPERTRFDQAQRDLVLRLPEQAISRTEHHRVDH